MQLPGMATEPVRVSLEVTWWPHDDSWGIARRGWRRDESNQWQLEEMSTSGSPLTRAEIYTAIDRAVSNLKLEIEASDDPFSEIGRFR